MIYMPTAEYFRYKSAILAANDSEDREALRQIQKQLIAKYGLNHPDVKDLFRYFKYTV